MVYGFTDSDNQEYVLSLFNLVPQG
jgi:hypothetical protein